MKKAIKILLSVAIAFSGQSMAYAALSQKVNFQGQITTTGGSPVTGTQTMTFKIYDSLTGGSILKTISNNQVTFSATGVYTVQLDLSGLNLNQDLWLGVTLGTDDEMSPRVQILPSPSSVFSISSSRSYGEMYASGSTTATAITLASAFVIMASPTTAGPLNNFTHSSGRLTYTGSATKVCRVSVSLTAYMTGTAAAGVTSYQIYKNGSPVAESQTQQYLSTTNIKGSVSLTSLVTLTPNDYLELWVTTDNTVRSLVIYYLNFNVTEIE